MSKKGKSYDDNMIAFLRSSWGRNAIIKNYGGNFWGPNRKRCSIFRPEVLAELEQDGVIVRRPGQFIVLPTEK